MKALFLRLYLALFLSLVVSAIGLDYLYSLYRADDDHNLALRTLWQSMAQAEQSAARASTLSSTQTAGLASGPASAAATYSAANTGPRTGLWLNKAELHWPAENWATLQQQGAVTLQDASGNSYFYGLADDGERVFVMPLPPPSSDDRHWFWLLAYYGSLALVVFLWLQPLVRDIDTLRRSVQALDLPTAELNLPIRQRSALTPVATALRDLRRHTAELMALQRDIANAVSHDIRTPLARIRFALAMLPIEADSALHRGIQADLSEIEQLVNEMLQYAQFEHSVPQLQKQSIPLQAFVSDLVARYQHHSSVHMEIQIPADAVLPFDPACLQRLLQNLLDNALRYANSHILLVWDATSKTLAVEDDGPGLPATEPDASAEFVSTGDAAGYGLGLAIVKKIALWHGGEMQLERSNALGGARVGVHFGG